MLSGNRKSSWTYWFLKLVAGSTTVLFLSAIALMAIPSFTALASGVTPPNSSALVATSNDTSMGSSDASQVPASSTGPGGGDIYEPPVINQGGDCIDGKIIDTYEVPIGKGWTIDVQGPVNDTVTAGTGGLFHFPSNAWLTQNPSATGYPTGFYNLTLKVPEGWQPFTLTAFSVKLIGSHAAGCAHVRYKLVALANLCVSKQDVGVTPAVGIPDWEITITNSDSGDVLKLKTDGLGKACFYNLSPGPYEILEEDKIGWEPWPGQVNPQIITLISPRNPGSVVDRVFKNKQMHDGTICVEKKDDSGNLLNGWKFTLKRQDGLFRTQTQYTGSNGQGLACFRNLALGLWELAETLPQSPWWQGYAQNPQTLNMTIPGKITLTFVNKHLGCVDGYKINNLDQGLSGWKITAQALTDNGQEIYNAITSTTPPGYFKFYLSLGTWTISETMQTGWTPVTLASFEVTVTKPGVCEHVRFKNATKYACVDVYKKDSFDSTGLPGWEINLAPAYGDGTQTLKGLTDGTGFYRFNGLTPGDYKIWETLQTGWAYVSPPNGVMPSVTLKATGTCKVVVFTNRQTNRPAQTLLDP